MQSMVGSRPVTWGCLLVIWVMVSVGGSKQNPGEIDGPCMGCRLFNFHHRQHPEEKPVGQEVVIKLPPGLPVEGVERVQKPAPVERRNRSAVGRLNDTARRNQQSRQSN
ncbi:hypothetical protein RRG08_063702 [Elysia crispata]|uniref:Secreted protein n=1 Tax=Elysia crispata TaxID=231223 RepID=A0AAE0ZYE8_9GAST|nr:hypothetical protein RRG08_063702 [Elysia crispata]